MTRDFALIAQNLPDVIDAAGVTALVWTASAAGGLVLGFAVALARRHGPRWLGLGLVFPVAILRVTVPELTMVVSAIGSQFYAFVESLFLLALFYWGLVEACGWLGRTAEARLARRIPAHA